MEQVSFCRVSLIDNVFKRIIDHKNCVVAEVMKKIFKKLSCRLLWSVSDKTRVYCMSTFQARNLDIWRNVRLYMPWQIGYFLDSTILTLQIDGK